MRALLLRALAVIATGVAAALPASGADRLQPYPVDPTQISVAGDSSGAFMANQIHVAHSAEVMGVALIAGGLYVIWLHRANVQRLLAGTEPRITQKRLESNSSAPVR